MVAITKEKPAKSKHEPRIVDLPTQKMAVIRSKGDPSKAMRNVLPALYSSVYKLKFLLKQQGRLFELSPLCARWPDAHLLPREEWTGIWGLAIPRDTTELPQKFADVQVRIEEWAYGPTAQILHTGPYSEEGPTLEHLYEFIETKGYEPHGVHEEVYLTNPQAKTQRTLIRLPIAKKQP